MKYMPAFTANDVNITPVQTVEIMFNNTDEEGWLCIPAWTYDTDVYDENKKDKALYYNCKMHWNEEDMKTVIRDYQLLEQSLMEITDEKPLKQIIIKNHNIAPFSILSADISDINELKKASSSAVYYAAIRAVRLCKLYQLGAPQIILDNEGRLLAEALVIYRYAISVKEFSVEMDAMTDCMRHLGQEGNRKYCERLIHAIFGNDGYEIEYSEELLNAVEETVNDLSTRKKLIITSILRDEISISELATFFEVDPDDIHDVKCAALRALRHPRRSKALKPFLRDIEKEV